MSLEVRRIDAQALPDAAAFHELVVSPCAPALLTGACRDWPLTIAAASPSALERHLADRGREQPVEVFVGTPAISGRYTYGEGPDGFNFERARMSFARAAALIIQAATTPDGPSYYVGSASADDVLPGLAEANRLAWLAPSVRPRVWLGNASRVACHFDAYDNIACVVAGRRRFTLFPPETIGDLYVGPIDHTMAGQPVSLAAEAAPGDTRYPRFERALVRRLTVELGPGDALYLPKLWWHQVEALAPLNLMVNFWSDFNSQGPDSPDTAMMLAMIAIAERPAAEREAWRAFFDHYVFRTAGHPLAHLPPDARGVLADLSGETYGRLRAMVMRALRGDRF